MARFVGRPARNKFHGPLSRGTGSFGAGTNPFTVSFDQAKSWFFSASQWNEILDPAEHRALNRIGWILMKKARGLIRNRKNPSRPLSSPSNQTGLLKQGLLYFYDEIGGNVIVGPTLFKRTHRYTYTIDRPTIPATLEFGGRERISKATLNRFKGRDYYLRANRVITIRPRPYMSKALEQKRAKCFQVFEDILGTTPDVHRVAGMMRPHGRAVA